MLRMLGLASASRRALATAAAAVGGGGAVLAASASSAAPACEQQRADGNARLDQHEERVVKARAAASAAAGAAARDARRRSACGSDRPIPRPRAPRPAASVPPQVFAESCDSVVHVTNMRTVRQMFQPQYDIPAGSGSGFVWDGKGHVVTNLHVVAGASELQVTFADQSMHAATIVGTDPDRDIAVLRIDAGPKERRPLRLGTSATLQVGQRTLAIGNPFGLDHTLTTGVVSGLGRDMMGRGGRPITGCIQTDAALNPGSSGGPLLNSAGEVIGLNTAIYSTSGASAGIGMSIPIDAVRISVQQIISHGHVVRPSLGVRMAPDHFTHHRIGVDGVLVFEVQPGSGAAHAGVRGTKRARNGALELGDVIVSLNKRTVKSSLDLFKAMEAAEVGDSVELELLSLADADGYGLREAGRRVVRVKVAGATSRL